MQVFSGGSAFCTASEYSDTAAPNPSSVILIVTSSCVLSEVNVKPITAKAIISTTREESITGL